MAAEISRTGKLRGLLQRFSDRAVFKPGRKSPLSSVLLRIAASGYLYLFIAGILAAFLFCSAISGVIASRLMDVQRNLADIVSRRQPSPFIFQESSSERSTEMKFSAFAVLESNPASADIKVEAAKPIDSFLLVGTLPRIGAWMSVDNATTLVLKSQDFNGYVLDSIERGSAIFTREGESYTVYLKLSQGQNAASAPPQQAPPQQQASPAADPNAAVAAAEFNGNDGMITRELMNDLLANPLAVMNTIRLIPEPNGMRVRSIRPDNMLARLGIKQGDTLTGINGISIANVTDFGNVIKSMLSGARFDLYMTRDQVPGKLGYVVR